MIRLFVTLAVGSAAFALAMLLQRRTTPTPLQAGPTRVPSQLDRADFERPDADWLVVAFTSATCDTCSAVAQRARLLSSHAVAFQEVEAKVDRELHKRYGIDSVPLVVIADATGSVGRYFLGPVSATDLWGAVAEARSPGTIPSTCEPGSA